MIIKPSEKYSNLDERQPNEDQYIKKPPKERLDQMNQNNYDSKLKIRAAPMKMNYEFESSIGLKGKQGYTVISYINYY